jgi:hypothetical protein
MREFKPMVKMQTTEPTVELKLKKGGAVKKMADGGMPMGAMIGAPKGGMMPGLKPKKPSLAARRRAMMASGAAGAPAGRAESLMATAPEMPPSLPPKPPAMKKGGEMESPKVHKAEMKELSGIKKELTKHEDMPASKGHRGLKTGGVVNGNGGFKTGGVAMANAGGFRKGGAAKKFAEGGRVQHDGGPEQMPQGKKKPAGPVSINQLSGTYKKGGAVMMANGGFTKMSGIRNPDGSGYSLTQKDLDRMTHGRDAQMNAQKATQMAAEQKAAAEKAAVEKAMVQKAMAQKAAAQKAAVEKIAAQKAAAQKAAVITKPTVNVSQPPQRDYAAAQKASVEKIAAVKASADMAAQKAAAERNRGAEKIQYSGPTSAGTIYRDGFDSGKNLGVSVSQPIAPQPNDDGGSGYGTGSVGMRRGGKVQHNGKKRGGVVC